MSNDISQYTITSHAAMAQEFHTLIKHQDFLAVTFNQGRDSFITLILEADPEQGRLIFDVSSDKNLNQKLTCSTKNIFSGSPRGIKTQFTTKSAQLVTYEGRPAFLTDFPDSLLRLQHREYFRITSSVATPLFCSFNTPKGKKIRLVVDDLSIGGVGLLMAENEYQIGLREILQECHIDSKDFEMVRFKLEVRGFKPFTNTTTGVRMVKMGCSFTDISKQDQVKVQRAIVNLERKMISKLGKTL